MGTFTNEGCDVRLEWIQIRSELTLQWTVSTNRNQSNTSREAKSTDLATCRTSEADSNSLHPKGVKGISHLNFFISKVDIVWRKNGFRQRGKRWRLGSCAWWERHGVNCVNWRKKQDGRSHRLRVRTANRIRIWRATWSVPGFYNAQ